MSRSILCLTVAVFGVPTAAADGAQLQPLPPAEQVFPTRISRLAADGTITERVEYQQHQRGDQGWDLVWDAFEPDPDDGWPCGGEDCGLPTPGYRWYLGSTYCNLYVTNDMQFDPAFGGRYAERIEIGWLWTVGGSGTHENCALIVEFYDDFDDTCTIGDAGLGQFLGGMVFYWGILDPPSGYLWTDVDLRGTDWLKLPADGKGAFSIWFATYEDADPDTLLPATCAQPMLWGTGDGEDPPDDRPGSQGPIQWDDVTEPEWEHQVPDECYDYTYGICPDPLCPMFCVYVSKSPGIDGDLNGDGCVDQSDLGILLADWGCTPPNDCVGDIDGDGYTGQSDLGALLANWGAGC